MSGKEEISKVIGVRVVSIRDIARFAVSLASLGQAPYVIKFRKNDKIVYGLLAVFRDYYKFYGLPLLYYYVVRKQEDVKDKHYILVKSDETGEKVEFAEGTKPGWIAIPIMELKIVPEFLDINVE